MPKISESSDEAEFDDNVTTGSSPRGRRASRGTAVNYNEDKEDEDDSSSDDDDIPLAALKSPSPVKRKKPAAAKEKAPAKKKAKTPAKKPAKKTTTTSGSKTTSSNQTQSDYSSPSFALYGTESMKGKLIQNLLCRWWYAITWPDPSSIPKEPPKSYDTLDGFPGVFICTEGDEVGNIKDFRDKEKSPSFNNFAKKTSAELQELLVKAINEQKRQLIESEGKGTETEKGLDSMLKWALKLNTTKADKEAVKVLKASKLSLPE